MPIAPSMQSADDPVEGDGFRLPDGTLLTPERAAEAGQQALDEALAKRRSAA